jgi:hypothetical protein
MTIDLACMECEASFELDVTELLDEPGHLTCPNCDSKAPRRKVEALASALDELLKSIASLAGKFTVTLAAETDDLPPSYEPAGESKRKAAPEGEEEEEETEEDEDDDEEGGDDFEALDEESDPED